MCLTQRFLNSSFSYVLENAGLEFIIEEKVEKTWEENTWGRT